MAARSVAPRTHLRPGRWYVIQCKPRQDRRALSNLERLGYRCYLPLFPAKEPVFPGHLFINMNEIDDNWYPIRSTRGVHAILRLKEQPVALHDELLEGIRQRLADSCPSASRPKAAAPIRRSMLSQLDALFATTDGEQRVALLLDILHSEPTIDTDPL